MLLLFNTRDSVDIDSEVLKTLKKIQCCLTAVMVHSYENRVKKPDFSGKKAFLPGLF